MPTKRVFSGEVCDGKDNNCNGQVDENNPGGGGNCSTGKLGVCAAGTLKCQNGGVVCTQNVSASFETCDGQDNNCNGQIDEGACCPYVFCHDGENWVYETTIGGGGLVGTPEHMDPQSKGRSVDFHPLWVRLDRAVPVQGKLRTKILIAEEEIAYLDSASLTLVEHPVGHEVLSASSRSVRGPALVDPSELIALPIDAFRTPLRASFRGEVDVTEAIGHKTDRAVASDPMQDGYYELDFGEVRSPGQARLVIDGWKLKTALRKPTHLRHRPYLEVEQDDGSFRRVLELSPPRGDRKAICVDLRGVQFPTGRYRMRVWIGTNDSNGMWLVDRMRLSEARPAAIRVREISASRAELGFSGAPTRLAANDPTRSRLSIDDGQGALLDRHRTFGRFTRYGDVRPLIGESNDMFVVMRQGDGLELEFDGVEAPPEGCALTAFLYTDLVFKPRRLPGTIATERTVRVEPLPWHGMDRYGTAAQGAYPDDEAHARYLAEWNTRAHGPEDHEWGDARPAKPLPTRARVTDSARAHEA